MNREALQYLVPIIDHISKCNPQQKNDAIGAIKFIENYFKRLDSTSNHVECNSFLEQRSIEAASSSSSSSSSSNNFRACMNLLHNYLKALSGLQPPQDLLALHQPLNTPAWDRFSQEFEELATLGWGAYGVVVKAKHLLDSSEYAVKKIPLKYLSLEHHSQVLKEVEIHSQMSHRNIAQYHSSWVQLSIFYFSPEDGSAPSGHPSDSSNGAMNASSSGGIVFEDSSRHPVKSRASATGQQSFEITASSAGWLAPISASPFELLEGKVERNYLPTLFIQMELGFGNLEQWLAARNKRYYEGNFSWSNKELLSHLSIFKDLLHALRYIHSKGFIHRDVKPANVIFARGGKEVLLSDFGLAKLMKTPRRRFSSGNFASGGHPQTANVGTPTYSAPEIEKSNYGNKIDIFSLGIILLELLHPFGSMVERAKVIGDLKEKRQLGRSFMNSWKQLAYLVLSMTEKDAKFRPSAAQILDLLYEKTLPSKSFLEMQSSIHGSLPDSTSHPAQESERASTAIASKKYSLQFPRKNRRIYRPRLAKSGIFRAAVISFCQDHQRKTKGLKSKKSPFLCPKDRKIKELENRVSQLEKELKSLRIHSGKA